MSLRSSLICLLAFGVLTGGCDRQVSAPEQAKATPAAQAPQPAAASSGPKEGEKVIIDTIGTLDRSHKGEAASAASFLDPAGKATSLAAFRGKPVLLNLWATWCGPCVTEMPTLDAIAKTMTVAAVSQDLGASDKVLAFFAQKKLANLQPYHDPKADLSIAYNAELPTSILYDSTGHEVWRMTGGMDWTTETAKTLLAEAH